MPVIAAALNIGPGRTYKAVWTVVAKGGSYIRKADTMNVITFNRPPAPDTLLQFNLLTPTNNANVTLAGDTLGNVVFTWQKSNSNLTGIVAQYGFGLDTTGGNFLNAKIAKLSNNAGADTSITLNVADISNALGLSAGMTYKADWRVVAKYGTYTRVSTNLLSVVFARGQFTGLNDINSTLNYMVYPNPANESINIVTDNKAVDKAYLIDMTGRTIELPLEGVKGTYKADVSFCMPGIYLLQLKYGHATTTTKIHISK